MVTFQEIEAAYERIKDLINKTPVMTSRTLNDQLKAEVFFKCENYQRVGAFKFRGASHAISQLTKEQKDRGVIAHSSGNHAQALALAAKTQGIEAVLVMPETSPGVKVKATRDTYGAKVVFCKNSIQARHETCARLMEEHGYTLVHPYDNDDVIRGAGTAALELLRETGPLDIVITPVGGGGLLSGTAIATKGFNPGTKVYAGEPKAVDDAYRSLAAGKICTNETIRSIADGLLTNLCERTFTIIKESVDRIITVPETGILEAMRFLWERMKMVVEPSGSVPLAALLGNKEDIQGKKIGVIVSGGNIDLGSFFSLLQEKVDKMAE